jgi:carboxyvinyl-carboxyphosphonate phosphorylmutase
VFPASVFDPISARIAEDLDYEVGMLAGSIASMTVLGAPDLIVLNQAELAEQARRICRAAQLPLVVDADHGFGNALNVRRTVEELETAGAAAVTIEDTVLPMPFRNTRGAVLVPVAEGVGKVRAALDGRADDELVIVARTSAASVTGTADAVARIKAYQDAGADMMMLVGVKSRDALDAIARDARVPLMLGGAGDGMMDADYLSSRGVRICLKGHQPFLAAVRALRDTLEALRNGVEPSELTGLAAADVMNSVTRDTDYLEQIRRYLDG